MIIIIYIISVNRIDLIYSLKITFYYINCENLNVIIFKKKHMFNSRNVYNILGIK